MPAQVEVHTGVAGSDVGRVLEVLRLEPVHVQCDPHPPRHKVLLVGPDVGPDLVAGGDIGGGARANDAKGHGAGPVTWRTSVRHGDMCRDSHLDKSLLGFIEGDPELDSVPELCVAQPGILLKAVRHLTALLAFLTLQGWGRSQQSNCGHDLGLQEGVDQVAVVIYPGLVILPNNFRKHTTPSNRKSEYIIPKFNLKLFLFYLQLLSPMSARNWTSSSYLW